MSKRIGVLEFFANFYAYTNLLPYTQPPISSAHSFQALLSVRILRGMRKFMDVESETELIKVIRAQEG